MVRRHKLGIEYLVFAFVPEISLMLADTFSNLSISVELAHATSESFRAFATIS